MDIIQQVSHLDLELVDIFHLWNDVFLRGRVDIFQRDSITPGSIDVSGYKSFTQQRLRIDLKSDMIFATNAKYKI